MRVLLSTSGSCQEVKSRVGLAVQLDTRSAEVEECDTALATGAKLIGVSR